MRQFGMIEDKYVSISLFSGAFGLDLGLQKAGFTTTTFIEKSPDCVRTIGRNIPELQGVSARKIEDVSSEMLMQEVANRFGLKSCQGSDIDLISGGPPCQPFSTAGSRQSILDPRGNLFFDFLQTVNEIRPKFFLIENVRGILSSSLLHRPLNERGSKFPSLSEEEKPGSMMNLILSRIQEIGYKVKYQLLDSSLYGLPQKRHRVFFVGQREDIEGEFQFPAWTHEGDLVSLREGLTGLVDEDRECANYPESRLKYLRLLSAGQNWRSLPGELQKEAMGGAYNSGGGKVGFYRRLDWGKPAPTITTSPIQKSTDMCHPDLLRPLSVRECARLQSFPDDWGFCGSVASKYKQIGNAVPPLMGRLIGEQIAKIL
jgi:DNA (cytosine-5)-methyltransferase 1